MQESLRKILEEAKLNDHNGLFCLQTLFQAKFTHHSVVLHKEMELVLNGNQKLCSCNKLLGRREALLSPFHKMGNTFIMQKAKRLNDLAKIIKMPFVTQRKGTLQVPAYRSYHCNGNTSPSAEGVLKRFKELAEGLREQKAGKAAAV